MSSQDKAYWETRAEQLTITGKAWINGEYTDAVSQETFDCLSPVDGRLLGKIASCSQEDADRTVASARAAFDSGEWSRAAPADRKAVLFKLSDLILEHVEELALLETLDMGKAIRFSLNDDIPGSAKSLRWCAEAIDKIYGEIAPVDPSRLAMITREPVGVVAAIVPWNFPLSMASLKLGPALATGNSVILKPSEKSSLTAIRLAQLAEEAGLPKGVLQVLPGYGHTVGKALALHNDVDCLAFTGSTRTARQLMVYAGESNMKRIWLEAGGKSPHIVFADCQNLEAAAKGAAMGIGYNQGEVCVAGSRLLVDEAVYDEFIPLLQKHLQAWQPGHPLDPESRAGAIVDEVQVRTILDYISAGREEGATLSSGGQRVMDETGGFYIEPTLFEGVSNTMKIAREEIFGPVVSVIRFSDEEEAVKIANDTHYGLAAGLWTDNLARAHRVAGKIRAGTVYVNGYLGGDNSVPFGGFKQSGNGRDKSLHAFDKFIEIKSTVMYF